MSEIIDNGAGTYTFRDAAALKKFLLIKDKCLGTAKKGPCKVDRKRVINALQPQLEEVVRAGFPSDTAAFELKKVACECICKNRHADVLSEHGETISQHDDLYNQWNRKLWVSYLKKNDASQGDKMKWEKVFGQLKCQSPAQTGMHADLRAISRTQLMLIQQNHLAQNKNPPRLMQTRTTAPVGYSA